MTTAPPAPTAWPHPTASTADAAPRHHGSGQPAITLPPAPAARTAAAAVSPRLAGPQARTAVTEAAQADTAAARIPDGPAPTTAATPNPAPARSAEPKKPWFDRNGPKIAMYAAVILCASGEYALAVLAGFPMYVAVFLPVAMDVYVIQAMRRHRDVAAALTLAVAANALDRLAEARLFGVTPDGAATWWLIIAVVAIAPFIVWRVHRITETRNTTRHATGSPRTETAAATATGETPRPVPPVTETPVAHTAVAATATPRETVRATLPARSTGTRETPSATASETPATETVAHTETPTHQREKARATRNATPRTRSTATPRATANTVATPIDRNGQLAIVAPFVDQWNGPADKLPLQPIADALGRSKPTASRLVREYRDSKTA